MFYPTFLILRTCPLCGCQIYSKAAYKLHIGNCLRACMDRLQRNNFSQALNLSRQDR